MKELRRSPDFYLGWMLGDGAGRRKGVAEELEAALKLGHYDQQTLEEINLVLAHELLCVENYQQLCRRAKETGAMANNFPRPALGTCWVERFIITYCTSLSRSICPSSHYERALQARGIGLALALLRSNQVRVLEDSFKSELDMQLKERFRTLQWLRQTSPALSGDVYRQFQTSYQLVFAGEYLKRFRQLEPLAVTFVNKFFSTLSLACSMASFTLGGGLPSLRNTIDSLSQIFTLPNPSVDSQYESLFAIQELTELTLALNRLAEALKGASKLLHNAENIHNDSQQFASEIISSIDRVIGSDTFRHFETDGSRRRSFLEYLDALTGHGPPAFDRYYFLYGLLDCVARLARILSLELMPPSLKTRMVQIATRSREPSFRWKAIEILLSAPASRKWQYSTALGVQHPSETLHQELKIILFDCLNEEEKVVLPERTHSLSSTEPLTSESNPESWSEDSHPSCSLPQDNKGIKTEVAKVGSMKRNFDSTGLSPDCQSVFFLRGKTVVLHSLSSNINAKRREAFKLENPLGSEWSCAALSNRFLVLSTKQRLVVYNHSTRSMVDSVTFETERYEEPWIANCLAIYEAQERVWIVVAGSQGMALNGSLRAYQIVVMPQSTKLIKHDASFQSSIFDAEFVKHVSFCPKGTRLVCVTHTNKVLAFFLSNNARPRESPFRIVQKYGTLETNAAGITSATLFYSWTNHPFVLCTTAPSSERSKYGNEWTYISAVGDGPNLRVPDSLRDNLQHLKRHDAILAGAVSPSGDLIALLEKTGRITLTSLTTAGTQRRLRATPEAVYLEKKLCPQSPAVGVDPTSLRFHNDGSGALWLKAADVSGSIVSLKVTEPASG